LTYGSFWYQHIPEGNFLGGRHRPYYYVGSLIYVFALAPTGLFCLGLIALVRRAPCWAEVFDPKDAETRRWLCTCLAASLLLGNYALMLVTVAKYHVWSVMQGRLLFPSMAGFVLVFGVGVEVAARFKTAAFLLKICMISLVALFGIYFASELGYLMLSGSNPDLKNLLKKL
jgi:hypothetical protein